MTVNIKNMAGVLCKTIECVICVEAIGERSIAIIRSTGAGTDKQYVSLSEFMLEVKHEENA